MRYQTTRRGALKAGLLGAGAFALNYPSARSDYLPASPATTPFLDPLPIARLAKPVPAFPTQADPTATNVDGSSTVHVSGPRQVAANTIFYRIAERQALHSFHRQLPPSSVWGYDGLVPGPTIITESRIPSLIRLANYLPENKPVGIGEPITAIHRHGGFQAPEDDGFPLDTLKSGQSRDYYFPNDPAAATLDPTALDPAKTTATIVTTMTSSIEQYEARSAATRGDATALRYILRNVKEKYSGDVVHVGLKRRSHRLVYQIKLIDPTGKMLLLRVDAKSGAILGEHGS